jgi:uncharacterized protein YkwD
MLFKKHISIVLAVGFSVFVLAPAAGAAVKASTATTLLRAVNHTRAARGLRALRIDSRLVRAARSHSAAMLRGNYFSHGDFHGRMVAYHVHGPAAGENLAWGTGAYATPAKVIAEWLASPEHRANLLRPGWTRIGIGLAHGSFLGNGGTTVVTADFAGR